MWNKLAVRNEVLVWQEQMNHETMLCWSSELHYEGEDKDNTIHTERKGSHDPKPDKVHKLVLLHPLNIIHRIDLVSQIAIE